MYWENFGLIFSTDELKKISEDLFFAKSPQFLLLHGVPTFYFATQRRDKSGKWVSAPCFVQYNGLLNEIERIHCDIIEKPGQVGCFDEHGVFPFSPISVGDQVWAYTTGWTRRISVDVDMSIGLCKSQDGFKFERFCDGPIMTHSLKEPFLVGDAFVILVGDTFRMWYIFGDKWLNNPISGIPERRYRIASALSDDGLNWKRNGDHIIAPHDENECQALPSVTYYNGRYHMVFCYRDTFSFRQGGASSYRLGYAYSFDSLTWKRDDSFVAFISARGDWDSEMQCYPNIFVYEDNLYCVYNGNDFGIGGFGLARLKRPTS